MTYRVPHGCCYREEVHVLWDSTKQRVAPLGIPETLGTHMWSVEAGRLVLARILHLLRVSDVVVKSLGSGPDYLGLHSVLPITCWL